MKRHKLFIFALFICLAPALALAQADCPTIVQSALDATNQACDATGRNQVCYGNVVLQASPQAGITTLNFSQPGDQADVGNIQTLTLSSRVIQDGTWGIALMNLQADLPDALPGQNVRIVLFGDVQIDNAVETNVQPPTVEVSASSSINIRGGPATSYAVVGTLAAGSSLTADGRLEDGSWLRVQMADGSVGWLSARLVTVTGDASQLEVAQVSEATPVTTPALKPMQAFYFSSGLGDRPCAEAPDSGILIQTPQGAGQVSLKVDEVDIQLGSTVYLEAQASGEMIINVVEGQATVSAFGVTVIAPAGTRVRVPLDANRAASGPPVGPEAYDASTLATLPLQLLPQQIAVAPAATPAPTVTPGGGVSGLWQVTFSNFTHGSCILDLSAGANRPSQTLPVTVNGDGSITITDNGQLRGLPGGNQYPSLTIPSSGVYSWTGPTDSLGSTANTELHVVSPTRIEGQLKEHANVGGPFCDGSYTVTIENPNP